MGRASHIIRRPTEEDWYQILDVLRTANFHHIGGPEMATFPLEDCFIADIEDRIVGVAGYRILDEYNAKTTLLVVLPEYRRGKIGHDLQQTRQDFLREQGIKTLFSNTDDQHVVNWYKRNFGYQETGKIIAKMEPFGRLDRDTWINLKVEL